jgi:hypothetical protein
VLKEAEEIEAERAVSTRGYIADAAAIVDVIVG